MNLGDGFKLISQKNLYIADKFSMEFESWLVLIKITSIVTKMITPLIDSIKFIEGAEHTSSTSSSSNQI